MASSAHTSGRSFVARRTIGIAAAVVIAVAAVVAGAAGGSVTGRPAVAHAAARRPNIVFILTDDLSWNLVNRRFAPHIIALEKRGETFRDYFVADSLCCPSRATIFTGLFPHDTKVIANLPPEGGFQKFQSEQLYRRTYAVAMQPHGYRTAMLGKYLNGYGKPTMTPATAPVPPGWTDWHVASDGYLEFNYAQNDNGRLSRYGGSTGGCGTTGSPDNYGVDVINREARSFIDRSRRHPFVVEASTFAPHAPYIPAPRNACDFPGLTEPRDPSFNATSVDPPEWLRRLQDKGPLAADQIAALDGGYRMRAQSVEAVDKLLADVEANLARDHLARSTYIVFSSDNGYHMGQHRQTHGKQTAFDTDIRVPLIVAGPGVPHGRTIRQVAQNVDLYPTFAQLAGAKPRQPVDGHSLVPLLHPAGRMPAWRTVALVEHHYQPRNKHDPDSEGGAGGKSPTTYEAIRISSRHLPHFRGPVDAVYVEYADAAHELEYYDVRKDPYELDNVAGALTAAQKAELHTVLARLERCHTARSCWAAGLPARR